MFQEQATPEEFQEKVRVAKNAQVTADFMVIARIESLILGRGMTDALDRAGGYIDAGADGVMIHSQQKSPDEILEFCAAYQGLGRTVPLVAVPSSYNTIRDSELADAGVNIVIHANHMLRAAYPAMTAVAQSILENGRSKEADQLCMSIRDILDLIPNTR